LQSNAEAGTTGRIHPAESILNMKKGLIIAALALLTLVGILLARTSRLTVSGSVTYDHKEINLQTDTIADRLAKAIQYKTISQDDPSQSSNNEFSSLHEFLRASFPQVHAKLSKEVVGEHSLLFTWKGRSQQLRPILLMAHMDVVPVDPSTEKSWVYPPFAGRTADGYIWGRGAMDDKVGVMGMLEAAEYLLTEKFQPERTVYLAFGHDEEIDGNKGAAKIAELLRSRQVQLEYVLDEGGNVTDGIIANLSTPVALIGIAEKGYVSVELAIDTPGGHSSMPPDHTAIAAISRAIDRLEKAPFPSRIAAPTREFLQAIGARMGFVRAIMIANLWLFDALIRHEMDQSPLSRAMIRTTQAPTIFQAGVKDNVLPTKAHAVINFRILTEETIADVLAHAKKTIDDPAIKITPLSPKWNPSAVSDIHSASFKPLEAAITASFPGTIIAPSLLIAATDSRHYASLTKNIYRFLPIILRNEDTKRFHGINERVAVKDYENCVRFYVSLIRNSQR
jgi:carboxypeptidase PM20D1